MNDYEDDDEKQSIADIKGIWGWEEQSRHSKNQDSEKTLLHRATNHRPEKEQRRHSRRSSRRDSSSRRRRQLDGSPEPSPHRKRHSHQRRRHSRRRSIEEEILEESTDSFDISASDYQDKIEKKKKALDEELFTLESRAKKIRLKRLHLNKNAMSGLPSQDGSTRSWEGVSSASSGYGKCDLATGICTGKAGGGGSWGENKSVYNSPTHSLDEFGHRKRRIDKDHHSQHHQPSSPHHHHHHQEQFHHREEERRRNHEEPRLPEEEENESDLLHRDEQEPQPRRDSRATKRSQASHKSRRKLVKEDPAKLNMNKSRVALKKTSLGGEVEELTSSTTTTTTTEVPLPVQRSSPPKQKKQLQRSQPKQHQQLQKSTNRGEKSDDDIGVAGENSGSGGFFSDNKDVLILVGVVALLLGCVVWLPSLASGKESRCRMCQTCQVRPGKDAQSAQQQSNE